MSLKANKARLKSTKKDASAIRKRHIRQKITINLDGDIVEFFKERAKEEGSQYQVLINQMLRDYVRGNRVEQLAKAVGEQLLADKTFIHRLFQTKLDVD